MMSFLVSYKTEISDSLKQVESQQGLEDKGLKKQQENLGPSLFRIAYNKKLLHALQTQSKASKERGLKNLKLPRILKLPHFMVPNGLFLFIHTAVMAGKDTF